MSVAEFLTWSEGFSREERYELVRGIPVRLMAPTIIRHAQIQANVADGLRRGLGAAGLTCRVYENGPGVAVDEQSHQCRIPDVVVTCAAEIDESARLVPEPLIVVEVASPSTRLGDVNDKVEFYERIGSIQHYLVIEQDHRRSIHYRRAANEALEPHIVRAGQIDFDPPGISVEMTALYRDTSLAV